MITRILIAKGLYLSREFYERTDGSQQPVYWLQFAGDTAGGAVKLVAGSGICVAAIDQVCSAIFNEAESEATQREKPLIGEEHED